MRALLVVLLVALTTACGENAPIRIEIDTDLIRDQAATWVREVGLEQADPAIWKARLERACGEGVWDPTVARELTVEFVEEDLGRAAQGGDVDPDTVEEAARALQDMARRACPERFEP
jgi:hypothetical protein